MNVPPPPLSVVATVSARPEARQKRHYTTLEDEEHFVQQQGDEPEEEEGEPETDLPAQVKDLTRNLHLIRKSRKRMKKQLREEKEKNATLQAEVKLVALLRARLTRKDIELSAVQQELQVSKEQERALTALFTGSSSTFQMTLTCVVCSESLPSAWVYSSTQCHHLICVKCYDGLDAALLCAHLNDSVYAQTHNRPYRLCQHGNVACPLCRKEGGYKTPPQLVDMVLTHSREDAKSPYDCDDCKVQFKTNAEAVEHHFNDCVQSFKCPNIRSDGTSCETILKASRQTKKDVYYAHTATECQFVQCNGCHYTASWADVQRCLQMHAGVDHLLHTFDQLEANVATLPHLTQDGRSMQEAYADIRFHLAQQLQYLGRMQPYHQVEEPHYQVQEPNTDLERDAQAQRRVQFQAMLNRQGLQEPVGMTVVPPPLTAPVDDELDVSLLTSFDMDDD